MSELKKKSDWSVPFILEEQPEPHTPIKEREQSESARKEHEADVAMANPLLNLAAALGQTPGGASSAPGTFAVKKRWDDGSFLFRNPSSGSYYNVFPS